MALRAQLICMIHIRRGLCGYKHIYWNNEDRTRNICVLIDRWRAVVDRFTFESEEHKLEIMSWSGTSPQFWTESEGTESAVLPTKSVQISSIYKIQLRAGSVRILEG